MFKRLMKSLKEWVIYMAVPLTHVFMLISGMYIGCFYIAPAEISGKEWVLAAMISLARGTALLMVFAMTVSLYEALTGNKVFKDEDSGNGKG